MHIYAYDFIFIKYFWKDIQKSVIIVASREGYWNTERHGEKIIFISHFFMSNYLSESSLIMEVTRLLEAGEWVLELCITQLKDRELFGYDWRVKVWKLLWGSKWISSAGSEIQMKREWLTCLKKATWVVMMSRKSQVYVRTRTQWVPIRDWGFCGEWNNISREQ